MEQSCQSGDLPAAQLGELLDATALEKLVDLAGNVGTDVRNLVEVMALCLPLRQLVRPVAQPHGGIAVGADAKRIRRGQFEQVADLLERSRDVPVVQILPAGVCTWFC